MYCCCKNVSGFCKCKSYSHFFSKNISIYAIFNGQSFNDTLTNDIVSLEQLGPDVFFFVVVFFLFVFFLHAEVLTVSDPQDMFSWINKINIFLIPPFTWNCVYMYVTSFSPPWF